MYQTIVIGGGISGLSVAYTLKKLEKNFLLLEKSHKVGGVIQSEKIHGFTIEKGANTVLIRNYETFQMFKDLGLLEKLQLPDLSASKRYILKNQKLIALPTGLFSTFFHPITPFTQLIYWAFKDYLSKPITHDISIQEFFIQRFGKSFYENLIFPMVSGIYAGNPTNMSLKYNFPKIFEYTQEYGSILKGFKNSPKIKISSEHKIYWNKMFSFEKGLQTLIEHLELFSQNHIQKNTEVINIEKANNLWKIYTTNQIVEGEQVILTTPAYVSSKLLRNLDSDLSYRLQKIYYYPLFVLHFTFPVHAWKKPLNAFGFLKSANETSKILGCIFNSRIFPQVSPSGYELVTVMVGGGTYPNVLEEDINALVAHLTSELENILKLKEKPQLLHLQKWEKAIPEYNLDYNELEKNIKNFENKYKNITILSNFWNGIGVPDCIQKGVKFEV